MRCLFLCGYGSFVIKKEQLPDLELTFLSGIVKENIIYTMVAAFADEGLLSISYNAFCRVSFVFFLCQ